MLSCRQKEGKERSGNLLSNTQKRRKAEKSSGTTTPRLQDTWRMIDYWQEKMNHILSEDWKYKREHWIEQCHSVL